jgi:hypothetical protein
MATVEVYESGYRPEMPEGMEPREDWRWRLKAGNGEIVASGEGYTAERDARRGFSAVAVAVLELVTEDVKEGVLKSWH